MSSKRSVAWLGLAVVGGALLALLPGCSSEDPSNVESTVQSVSNVVDAQDRAFTVRASLAILGRPPRDAAELGLFQTQLGAATNSADLRHGAQLDYLMNDANVNGEFTRHWESVLYDVFKVARGSGTKSNSSCWSTTVPPAQPNALAQHLLNDPPNSHVPSGVTAGFTMRDVVEASIGSDTLKPMLRANLFAQMSSPANGNAISEANIRADFWTRFESSYLNRQQLCLQCHNPEFSTAGRASDWSRHNPLPEKMEKAALGCSNGECQYPPDLHADFRFSGVVGGSEAPWDMSSGCGTFVPPDQQPAEPACTNLAPGQVPSTTDVCFSPAPGFDRQAPKPEFGQTGVTKGSVYNLASLLMSGSSSLATTGLGTATTPLVNVTADGNVLPGARAFAMLVAGNMVERVWQEVYGSRLTLTNHVPRIAEQRDVLHELTRQLVAQTTGTQWSLKKLLRLVILRPEFNAAAGQGDLYPMDPLFNPWMLHDPRLPLHPDATQRCSSTTPSFQGCIRGLIRKYRCVNCHENPEESAFQVAPFFHDDSSTVRPLTISQSTCDLLKPGTGANVDCSTAGIGGKPGSLLAFMVSRTDGLRMPLGLAPLEDADRAALVTWVTNGAPEGTDAGTDPPPNNDPIPVTRNGVGDRVQWKSPYQLTSGMGSALGLSAWQNGPFPGSGYPSSEIAETAGHYIEESKPGGRGFSILSVLKWESTHTTNGEFCRFGSGADRIDGLVVTGANVRSILGALKQSFMGESDIETAEQGPLEAVLGTGVTLATTVNAQNQSAVETGVRRVCRVFMKSPLFLLSYLEPPSNVLPSPLLAANAAGRASSGDFLFPAICEGRLDCRPFEPALEELLAGCFLNKRSCNRLNGTAITSQVTDTLAELRLPVARPALDLARALVEAPALVPSPNDPRLQSTFLVLPFGGGRVVRVLGNVDTFFNGDWRKLRRGETIPYGEVSFVPEHTRLSVKVGNDIYDTDFGGMEDPPDSDAFDAADGSGSSPHHHHHQFFPPHHHQNQNIVWIIVANGPQARTAEPPGTDPRVGVGQPHGPPALVPMAGSRPAWANYGEGGLWYTPQP